MQRRLGTRTQRTPSRNATSAERAAMKFAKQQFSAWGPIRDYCLKSNPKMKTTSGFSE
jgi:hypothetical protein